MVSKSEILTPLMKQYYGFKREHPDKIIFFRMGDFYEMFGEDAIKAAPILGVTLTSRSGADADHREPLAGVPYHSADKYLSKLLRAGEKVVVVEQVEDPKTAKGIVKRDIVEILTPGTSTLEDETSKNASSYLAAIHPGSGKISGMAYLEMSTAEFKVMEGSDEQIAERMAILNPREIIFPESTDDKTLEKFLNGSSSKRKHSRLDNYHFDKAIAEEELKRFFDVTALDGFGLGDTNLAIGAGGAILRYLKENRRDTLDHINRISCVEKDNRMTLDSATVRNLELVEPLGHGDAGISLFDVIDKTITPGGARRLKRDLVEPFLKIEPIRKRQEAVGIARSDREGANEIRKTLRIVPDLARLAGRLGIRRFSPRQALSLGQGLQAGRKIVSKLKDSGSELLQSLIRTSPDTTLVSKKLISALTENPPLLISQGGIIRAGASAELDKVNESIASAKNYMAGLQNSEREATGIPTLRVGFNKVFGYYLEITHKHKNRIPERYIRKQTLVNAERYITEEMKVQEDLIQAAEEKIHKLERQLFEKLVEDLIEHIPAIQLTAEIISEIDVIYALAELAVDKGYTKPEMDESGTLEITAGRHPVIESISERGSFVPNDLTLDNERKKLMILTGPNMAGKSTYLRQAGHIVILAQIGSFVPAQKAKIGLVDRVFTRVGAVDYLSRGQSTFMVEMLETANILNNATSRSLILLDEIGRGTSTYDGLAIAWAVVEALHNDIGARTAFATHYHELTALADTLEGVFNCQVAVKRWEDKVIFLHSIVAGGCDDSYGIDVSRLAGMPASAVERAREILMSLESEDFLPSRIPSSGSQKAQISLFEAQTSMVEKELSVMDVDNLTPLEALNAIERLKKMAQDKK